MLLCIKKFKRTAFIWHVVGMTDNFQLLSWQFVQVTHK